MKWNKPAGSTQGTCCGNYVIVQANSQQWIAYALSPYATGKELGVVQVDEKNPDKAPADAREICESHERELMALRKAG